MGRICATTACACTSPTSRGRPASSATAASTSRSPRTSSCRQVARSAPSPRPPAPTSPSPSRTTRTTTGGFQLTLWFPQSSSCLERSAGITEDLQTCVTSYEMLSGLTEEVFLIIVQALPDKSERQHRMPLFLLQCIAFYGCLPYRVPLSMWHILDLPRHGQ